MENYLTQHQIAPLFENLMKRLLLERPQNPHHYMATLLFENQGQTPATVPTKKPFGSIIPRTVLVNLPKTDLHVNLESSIRLQTIIELAKEHAVEIPTWNAEKLGSSFSGPHTEGDSLKKAVELGASVLQSRPALERVTMELLEDCVKDGCWYVEIRMSPHLHTKEGLSYAKAVYSVLRGIKRAQLEFKIRANLVLVAQRNQPPEQTLAIADVAARYVDAGVVAMELEGVESGPSHLVHAQAFQRCREHQIPCTLKAANDGWVSLKSSIINSGVRRICHGLRIRESSHLEQYISQKDIVVSACVSSNVACGALGKIAEHPIQRYLDNNVLVTLCTEYRTIAGVNLVDEYLAIQDTFGFTVPEMVRIMMNGFVGASLRDDEKEIMMLDALKSMMFHLDRNGFPIEETFMDYHQVTAVPMPVARLKGVGSALSSDDVREVPKADLHRCLETSVSAQYVFQEIQEGNFFGGEFPSNMKTFDNIKAALKNNTHHARRLMLGTLQTKEQLQKGIVDLFRRAHAQNMKYMEILLRPSAHMFAGMTESEVIDVVAAQKKVSEVQFAIESQIILYVDLLNDPVADLDRMAVYCVQTASVAGVAVLGTQNMEKTLRNMAASFSYLRENYIPITLDCAHLPDNVIMDLAQTYGIERVCNLPLPRSRKMYDFLSRNNVLVEIRPEQLTEEKPDKAVEDYIDEILASNAKIALVSQNMTLSKDYVESLLYVADRCKSSYDFLKLMSNSITYSHADAESKRAMLRSFWKHREVMLDKGVFDTYPGY